MDLNPWEKHLITQTKLWNGSRTFGLPFWRRCFYSTMWAAIAASLRITYVWDRWSNRPNLRLWKIMVRTWWPFPWFYCYGMFLGIRVWNLLNSLSFPSLHLQFVFSSVSWEVCVSCKCTIDITLFSVEKKSTRIFFHTFTAFLSLVKYHKLGVIGQGGEKKGFPPQLPQVCHHFLYFEFCWRSH